MALHDEITCSNYAAILYNRVSFAPELHSGASLQKIRRHSARPHESPVYEGFACCDRLSVLQLSLPL